VQVAELVGGADGGLNPNPSRSGPGI